MYGFNTPVTHLSSECGFKLAITLTARLVLTCYNFFLLMFHEFGKDRHVSLKDTIITILPWSFFEHSLATVLSKKIL